MKKCPFCAEEIQDNAIICRYCHSNLQVDALQNVTPQNTIHTTYSIYKISHDTKRNIFCCVALIMNIIVALSVLFPVFSFSGLGTVFEYGNVNITTSFSPVGLIDMVQLVDKLNEIVEQYSVGSTGYQNTLMPAMHFLLGVLLIFAVLTVATGIYFVRAIININHSKRTSLECVKTSIKFVLGINATSIGIVILWNLFLSTKPESTQMLFNLSFPVSAVAFLVLSVVFIIVINQFSKMLTTM